MEENGNLGLPIQFAYIDRAAQALLGWTKENILGLLRIEYSVPFIPTDKSLDVFLFFPATVKDSGYTNDKSVELVKDKYLEILSGLGYPEEYLKAVIFSVEFDSVTA
jgi:hypothetical protein